MSTTTPNMGFILPTSGDRGYGPWIDGDFSQIDISFLGALYTQETEDPSTTLHVAISPGNYQKQDGTIGTYAGTTSVTTTASTTNYLYLDLTASGVLVVNTTGFPTTAHVRIATVNSGSSSINTIADARVAFQVIGSFLGQLTGGAKTADATYTTNVQTMVQLCYNALRALGAIS